MRTIMLRLCLCFAMAQGAVLAGQLEDLGVPMRKGGFRNACVGPDASGRSELMYFNFSQEAAPLFLVSVDPQTGESHQYSRRGRTPRRPWPVLRSGRENLPGHVGQRLPAGLRPQTPGEKHPDHRQTGRRRKATSGILSPALTAACGA